MKHPILKGWQRGIRSSRERFGRARLLPSRSGERVFPGDRSFAGRMPTRRRFRRANPLASLRDAKDSTVLPPVVSLRSTTG